MKNKFLTLLLIIVIFAMTATAQTLTPNEKGEVSAITPEVRSLMEQTEKTIAETADQRLAAYKDLRSVMAKLEKVIGNESSTSLMILRTKLEVLSKAGAMLLSRRPVSELSYQATTAYFNNVAAIVESRGKLASDDYRKWQDGVITITKEALSILQSEEYRNLLDNADRALESARKREKEEFERMRKFVEDQQSPRNKI